MASNSRLKPRRQKNRMIADGTTMNHLKTFILLAALTALFGGVGYLIGGATGMAVALVFAGGMNLFSYWNADKIVLKMYRAQPVDEQHPNAVVRNYVADVRQMARDAGLPQPQVAIIPSDQPNAFATGRNPERAAVCATTGLLDMLTREEVRGVMAHELAHVKNRDTLIMTVTATIAGAIAALANFALFFGGGEDRERPGGVIGTLALMILAPMAAGLVQMAISRGREYEADRIGAEIAGDTLDQGVALGMHRARVERVASPAHAQEAGGLLERLGAQTRHLTQFRARLDATALVAQRDDRLRQRWPDPRDVGEQGGRRGVHLDADAVHAAGDHFVQA